jgi:tetratricopeptide (TPR) repeat protein
MVHAGQDVVVMKNRKSHQMFLDEKNLAILIITRVKHGRLMSRLRTPLAALLLLISTVSFVLADPQSSQADALSVREHIYKGNALMNRHDYEGAIAEYEEALSTDPSSTTAKDNIVLTHNNWGIDFFHQKKYDEAREQWNMALKLNPNDRNAKNNLNVLRVQLNKLGPSANGSANNAPAKPASEDEAKSGGMVLPKGAQTAKEDTTPVPSAVIIGRPTSTGTQFSSAAENANPSVTTGGGSSVSNSAGSGSGNAFPSGSAAAVIMPKSSSVYATNTSSTATTTTQPTASSSSAFQSSSGSSASDASHSAASSSLSTSNIEDKLAALENKVYGRPSKDLPILQRLERLERDTSSRPSLGSINDRVQTLIKTYGL